MALHWPTFFTRLGSAIVFAAVMMAGLLWNEWAFLVLVALIMMLCLRDYFRLMEKIDGEQYAFLLKTGLYALGLLMMLLIGAGWSASQKTLSINQTIGWTNDFAQADGLRLVRYASAWLLPAFVVIPALLLLYAGLSGKSSLAQGLKTVAGIFYVIVPAYLLVLMHGMHWAWPLALILMIWMNDTMAYLVGSFIGKTPFSPISPKKTWEGTAGGAILTIAGAAIWGYFSEKFRVADAVVTALCAAVAGTAGDLFESKLKRMAGVKDSGTLMPGHGGALDRFDSLLVATPFAFCYLYIVSL